LLHRKRFREAWRGGGYAIEITWNARYGWHVHLHSLVDGGYVPQAEIAAAWAEVTGDGRIVDIRAVRNPRQVFKYILKPNEDVLTQPDLFRELVDTIEGSRLFQPWGTWSGNHRPVDADDGDLDDGPGRLDEGTPGLAGVDAMRCPYCGGRNYRSTVWREDVDVSHVPLLRRGDNGTGWVLDG